MKRIGLLSDTHSQLDAKILEYFKDVDEIWHAGDIGSLEVLDRLSAFKKTRAVFGNIDNHEIRRETKKDLVFEIEGLKVCITHYGGRPNRSLPNAVELINKEKPGLFICGHSHIALVQFDAKNNLLWMNPGACGNHGIHKIRTVLRFAINEGKCEQLEIIEFTR